MEYNFVMMKKTIHSAEHKNLISKLIEAREMAGLKQEDVAKLLEVTQSFISKVESCQTRIDIFQLKEFAKIYKKDLKYFLK